jgi:hypothetical protein
VPFILNCLKEKVAYKNQKKILSKNRNLQRIFKEYGADGWVEKYEKELAEL